MSAVSAVRADIRAISPYSMPLQHGVPIRAKLDFNESPFDVPEEVKRRVAEQLLARRWSLYPEFGSPRLKAAVNRLTLM